MENQVSGLVLGSLESARGAVGRSGGRPGARRQKIYKELQTFDRQRVAFRRMLHDAIVSPPDLTSDNYRPTLPIIFTADLTSNNYRRPYQ